MGKNNPISKPIFISYHDSDCTFVIGLAESLKHNGINVWVKDLDVKLGSRKDYMIEDALEESETVMLVYSKASVACQELRDHASFSLDQNKAVVPIMIESCDIPRRLKRLQYIDFGSNINEATEKLIKSIALKSTNISTLSDSIAEQLTEGELELLKKKEIARKKYEKAKRNRRVTRRVLIMIFAVVLFYLANKSYMYGNADMTDFKKIENQIYGLSNQSNKSHFDDMFEQHLDEFKFCVHRDRIERMKWEFDLNR